MTKDANRTPTATTGPRHGDRGDWPTRHGPRPLTITFTRQAGARGSAIARRVGRKLGWQVVDPELLEFLADDSTTPDELTATARHWSELRWESWRESGRLTGGPALERIARTILRLAAAGEVVLVGRGAGFLLPAESTLHVRVIAPWRERVAYFAEWQRLTEAEAAEQVRQRDRKRAELVRDQLGADPDDADAYDLVINSGRVSEDVAAELIVAAARQRTLNRIADPGPAFEVV